MNYLLLMMGGSGTRFGADIPKQFVEVNGKPVFSYIMEKYASMDSIDGIVAVCHKEWIEYTLDWGNRLCGGKKCSVVCGGSTRSESVLNGLNELKSFAAREDAVLAHDATHPYVDIEGVEKIILKLTQGRGVTLGAREYDTMYRIDENGEIVEVVPREYIVSGASPEAFQFGDLYDIYTDSTMGELEAATSVAALAIANGIKVDTVSTDLINLKITHKQDMEVFEKLFYGYYF